MSMATKKKIGDITLPLIEEGDEGFDVSVGKRGLPDVVSPVMNTLVEEMLSDGRTIVQLKPGDPFTIAQLRYWQPKGTAMCPEGKRVGVSGGANGRNISIQIKDVTEKNGDAPVEKPKSVKPKTAKVAKRRPAKRVAAQ
jgi:hypothetical protein